MYLLAETVLKYKQLFVTTIQLMSDSQLIEIYHLIIIENVTFKVFVSMHLSAYISIDRKSIIRWKSLQSTISYKFVSFWTFSI